MTSASTAFPTPGSGRRRRRPDAGLKTPRRLAGSAVSRRTELRAHRPRRGGPDRAHQFQQLAVESPTRSRMTNRCGTARFPGISARSSRIRTSCSSSGPGYISLRRLKPNVSRWRSCCGENLDDLLTTAKTVQTIYNKNYQFFRPPMTPHMTAVPDDKKVTLYWDTTAEESVDPITGKDFEGYVIYRSIDPASMISRPSPTARERSFSTPLRDLNGTEGKWDVAARGTVHRSERQRCTTGGTDTDVTGDGTGPGRRAVVATRTAYTITASRTRTVHGRKWTRG